MKKNYIYILPEYTNQDNLESYRDRESDEFKISYKKENIQITFTEKNSLLEEEYGLTLKSAKYLVEGKTEVKESMIHHHQKGHASRHLQFKLQAQKQTIRIFLDNLTDDDYEKCIKGFLSISQDILTNEQKENNIKENLIKYFFNEKILTLNNERKYLLQKISESFNTGLITDASNKSIDKKRLLELQKENHIQPFLKF